MLDKIIKFSLQNRLLVLSISILLFITGSYTAFHAEVDVFPDLNAPTVAVMTEAKGMAAEEVETTVTFPIETAMNGAPNVRRVRSSSTYGFSIVWVEFDWDTDIYLARQIVSEKLSTISNDLPDHIGKPVLGPQSSVLGELLIIGLTSDTTSLQDLRTIADWSIRPRLLSVGGVAQTSVLGGDIKEYQIQLYPERMRHYNITLQEVLEAVRGMNINSSGGVIYGYGNEYIVRGILSTSDVKRMAKAVIRHNGTRSVILEDIADIRIGTQEPKLGTASEKGRPAVLMTITKQPNTGTVELTEKLEMTLKDLQKDLPSDIHISTDIFRQSRFIESSIGNVKESLYEGAIFVVLVLFLFLANARTTLISLTTLPLSLVIAILILHFMDLSINTMSLGGLAIAIGSLVDDAIVDVENVWKHLNKNRELPAREQRPILEVVFRASREVRMPILNSTLIIAASFVPLFFLNGMEGRMLIPLGIAFIVALTASTLVALTLTPVLCSFLLGKKKVNLKPDKEPKITLWLKKHYRKKLLWSLEHKKTVIGGTLILLILAGCMFFTLGTSFLPPFNEGSFTINISSLPGISLEESDRTGRKAEELLLAIPEIITTGRKTGRAELDEHALGINVSEIEAPYILQERTYEELLSDIRKNLGKLPGVNIEIGQPISHRIDAMLSGTKASIAIKLFGENLNRMFTIGKDIEASISKIEGIADLNVELQIERPELKIVPRLEMLAVYGITLPQFNEFVNVNLAGEKISQVYENGKLFQLIVRTSEQNRNSVEHIKDLMIDDAQGRKVPLASVADIRSTLGPNTINRENVKRKIVISANTDGRDLGSVINDIRHYIDEEITLPEGYHIEYGGQFESEQTASRMLTLTSLISIMAIFLLLYMQFRNAAQSFLILFNLPLALIGGIFSLFITGGDISIPAIIGFISLFGIATRNGMLLISHYNQLYKVGKLSLRERILSGSEDRLNPILMTALSSALALIPLIVRGGLPGNEIQSPMAKVIFGGLLTSTFLNAFLIPIMYEWMNRKETERSNKNNK